jgi:hypothetical protein
MSKLFVYRKSLSAQGVFSGTYKQTQAISYSGNYGFRIVKASFSNEIPNVFTSVTGDRTDVLWITRDGGANWLQINFIPGLYTIDLFNLAVATAMLDSGWIPDLTALPIVINADKVNGFTYVRIVSANCAPPGSVCGVHFGTGAAPFDPTANVKTGPMLGFSQTASFVGDGLYNAPSIPLLDTQGSAVDLVVNFPGVSYENGQPSNLCAVINIPPYSSGVEIVYPRLGDISPILLGAVPSLFTGVDIKILSARTKRDIEFLYGDCVVTFEIFYVGKPRS